MPNHEVQLPIMRTAFLWALCAATALAQSPLSWSPELSLRVQKIGDVTAAPDGKSAAWTQTRNIIETEKSEPLTHIFLWRQGRPSAIQLTRGEKGSQDPAFTPDGKWLLFVSERSGKKNLYRIAVDGGEAEMLTDWKGTLGVFHISPDGSSVGFTGSEEDKEIEKAKKEKRDIHIVDDKPNNHSLWLIAMDADANGKREPKKLASGKFHIGEFRWSPDGKSLAYEKRPRPDFNNSRHSDIAEVEVATSNSKMLVATEATESQPRYSPDGRYLAFVQSQKAASMLYGSRVALLDRGNGKTRLLTATPDERPQLLEWSRDSSRILVTEPLRTRSAVYALPVDGPLVNVYVPEKGVARLTGDMTSDGKWSGAIIESPTTAPEAYLLNIDSKEQRRISRANADLPKAPLGETSLERWKSKDGREIEGLLTLPVGYTQGNKYPLALIIHGGPAGAFTEAFTGAAGVQSVSAFAAKGYAVLRVNPRGSVGYGVNFTTANLKDWGGADYQDIMTGVDNLIRKGIADQDHMAVMGWSYGGYMTSWVVSQTQRFKAAIIGAGITNLWSMWGTNDIPSVLDDYFDGSPWDQPDLYRDRSGLFFVKNVKTPTLFLHGEVDLRVPIGQAYEYYHAMKKLGVETQMVTYPRTPHGPSEPKFVQDVMQRHIDWVEKHIR